jgi:hypothetical protein
METDKKCKELVKEAYKSRMKDITKLWAQYKNDSEANDPELGRWDEYGLSFDYVPKDSFSDQRKGYFRYQISWGGPSEEFRIYADECLEIDRIEFWYLDWFDGAKVQVTGKALQTWHEIWADFKEMDLLKLKMMEEAMGEMKRLNY